MPEIYPFNAYEIQFAVERFSPDGETYVEAIGFPHELEEDGDTITATFWTLYGHFPEGGVQAVSDFESQDQAIEMYERITGLWWPSPNEIIAEAWEGSLGRTLRHGRSIQEEATARRRGQRREGPQRGMFR